MADAAEDVLRAVLPRVFGQMDPDTVADVARRLRGVSLPRGDWLFRAGDVGDAVYLVVRGRLGVVGAGDTHASIALGPGEVVGELALLTGAPRSASIRGERPTELLRLDREDFEELALRYPALLLFFSRKTAERLQATRVPPPAPGSVTFAVVPLGPEPEVRAFAGRFAEGLRAIAPCAHVEASAAWDPGLLDRLEATHRFLVLDTGPERSAWSRACLAQADQILLVARAAASPDPGPAEAGLHDAGADHVPASLVLIRPDGPSLPSGTARWLDPRTLRGHHHARAGHDGDVRRIARLLAGHGVGLVLGGGGALGAAHIGVIEVLLRSGVPIDAIGGTSVGGGIGAQLAMGLDAEQLRLLNRAQFVERNPFRSVTLPILGLVPRASLDRTAREIYGDLAVEDLPTPYFCVSTNLTRGAMKVHRRGPLWRAVRATTSIPGIAPPVLEGGEVLVDGGVVDNLPVETMRELCGVCVAVDLSTDRRMVVPMDYDDLPGPLALAWNRALRNSLPTLPRVLLATVAVGGHAAVARNRARADLLFQPPLERFGQTQFGAFEEIRTTARDYAEAVLAGVDLGALTRGAR